MNKRTMTDFKDSEILCTSVRGYLERIINDNYDVSKHCGLRIKEKQQNSISVLGLIKDEENQYHVIYLAIEYKTDDKELTTTAMLNSPKLTEIHEVLQPKNQDVVEYFIREVCDRREK